MKKIKIIVLGFLVAHSGLDIYATLITYGFSGSVITHDDTDNALDCYNIGNSVLGTFSYDTDLPDFDPSTWGKYRPTEGLSLMSEGIVWKWDSSSVVQIEIRRNTPTKPPNDFFTHSQTMENISSANFLSRGGGFVLGTEGGFFPNDSLPLSLDETSFGSRFLSISFRGTSTNPSAKLDVGIRMDDIYVIPEPATALLFGIGGVGAWLVRRNKFKAKEGVDR